MMDLRNLLGKKIVEIEKRCIVDMEYDDVPYLYIKFDDDTDVTIVGDYGGFSGESYGEYPRYVRVYKGEIKEPEEEYEAESYN